MHIKTQLKLQALIVPPLLPFLHFFLAAFAVLSWLPKINYLIKGAPPDAEFKIAYPSLPTHYYPH